MGKSHQNMFSLVSCVLTLAVVCAQCVQQVDGGAAQELLPQGVAAPQLQVQTALRRHITAQHRATHTLSTHLIKSTTNTACRQISSKPRWF